MNDVVKKWMYRLYGLAENAYFDELERAMKEGKEQGLERKSIVVREEPEDNDGDEWTMFQKDYDIIREIMEVYDGQLTLMKKSSFVTIVEAEDETTHKT